MTVVSTSPSLRLAPGDQGLSDRLPVLRRRHPQLREPGSIQRSNARWLTLSPLQTVIPAGESVTIRFAAQVPSDQTLRGTYWSVIMVELVPPSAPESSRNESAMPALGIRQVVRYAVQVITTVEGTGSRQIRFSQVRLVSDNGKRQLVVDLENTGERLLRTSLWADLYDPKGSFVGKFDGGSTGCTRNLGAVHDRPRGPWPSRPTRP